MYVIYLHLWQICNIISCHDSAKNSWLLQKGHLYYSIHNSNNWIDIFTNGQLECKICSFATIQKSCTTLKLFNQ